MNIDQDLHRALRRQPGPHDLAERVLARIDDAGTTTRTATARLSTMRWLAAAAAIALAAAGGTRYYTYQQQAAEAERVKAEIRLALQITSATLAQVQQKVETSLAREDRQGTP